MARTRSVNKGLLLLAVIVGLAGCGSTTVNVRAPEAPQKYGSIVNAVSLAEKGAAGGVPSLNGSSQLVQELKNEAVTPAKLALATTNTAGQALVSKGTSGTELEWKTISGGLTSEAVIEEYLHKEAVTNAKVKKESLEPNRLEKEKLTAEQIKPGVLPSGDYYTQGFTFETATTLAKPATGGARLNNAEAKAATKLYVSLKNYGGTEIKKWLESFKKETRLVLQNSDAPTTYAIYTVKAIAKEEVTNTLMEIELKYVEGSTGAGTFDTTAGAFTLAFGEIAEKTIPGSALEAAAVATTQLASNAVTNVKVENETLETKKIAKPAKEEGAIEIATAYEAAKALESAKSVEPSSTKPTEVTVYWTGTTAKASTLEIKVGSIIVSKWKQPASATEVWEGTTSFIVPKGIKFEATLSEVTGKYTFLTL